ncbi:MAG: hypothetical protein WEE64_14775 [Dehalococcoidia bacterium]
MVNEAKLMAEREPLGRLVFIRCCRLLTAGTAVAGLVMIVVTTVGAPDLWASFLWNTLFLAVPTMLFTSFFGAMTAISSDLRLSWQRIARDFAVGLAGALAVPLGVMFVFFQGAITPTAGLYFLIGLGTHYVLWRDLRAISRPAADASLEPAGAPEAVDGAAILTESDSAVA